MPKNNCKIVLGLCVLVSTTAFSQTERGYSVFDSSVISSKKMPQQNEFWNNSYDFPARPRDMWEFGASVGTIAVSGDVPARVPAPGFEVHTRKALGYVFSMRLQYIAGTAKGLNWNATSNFQKNPAWLSASNGGNLGSTGYNPITRDASGQLRPLNTGPQQLVFQNYRTRLQDLSLQGIVTLNNLRFHKQKTSFIFYIGGGIGATLYNAKVNALNGSTTYATLFQSQLSTAGAYKERKDVLKALKDGMDDSYETDAENEGERRPKIGDNIVRPSITVMGGIGFKLSNRINIALEDRHSFVKSDLLDGARWQEHPLGDAALTSDFDSYNFLSLGINFNVGAKSVEPLWWLNPLDYAYAELNNPRHMKLPKPVFDDADGDGVTDMLDREPTTSAGCPVDAHGVTKDTDGDGVADCNDKQLITPTECQPVDADGVGKCPEPACCAELKDNAAKRGGRPDCPVDYPSLQMKGTRLTADAKAMCAAVAAKLQENPTCSIVLTAYPGSSKTQQSLAGRKLDAIRNYLVETLGISSERIATDQQIGAGDENTVDIKTN